MADPSSLAKISSHLAEISSHLAEISSHLAKNSSLLAKNLPLVIGGLIGFIAAVWAEQIRHLIWGPKLKVEFIEGEKGFKTNTKDGHIDAHYVRVRVLNTGRQVAKQCRAYLVNVEKWDESIDDFGPTIYCDSLQLAWSAQTNNITAYRALDIPKGIPQFIDLISTRQGDSNYRIKTELHLNRYKDLFEELGKFRYTVLVAGDNAEPKSREIIFEWMGDWDIFIATAG
jgi:hypothetical protein